MFTVTLDAATGHYVYTQFAALDHADGANANDVITLSFAVEATDSDGDGASTTLVVGESTMLRLLTMTKLLLIRSL